MGMMGMSSSSLDREGKSPQFVSDYPNPSNYKIIRYRSIAGNCMVELEYPDCTNYEGRKILIFKNVKFKPLREQGLIDPHFSDNGKYLHPFMRIEPTNDGWEMGVEILKSLRNKNYE